MYLSWHVWKAEAIFQELVLSFYHVGQAAQQEPLPTEPPQSQ